MNLALFDLDNTLLAGDSDYLWGEFLCEKRLVDPLQYARANQAFYKQYQQGQMNIGDFLNFALQPLKQIPLGQLFTVREEFLQTHLSRLIAPGALALIDRHRNLGDTLAIITATNRFVSAPFARELGISHLIATEPTIGRDGFDGGHQQPPCFQAGKLANIDRWLTTYGLNPKASYAYSDSFNDLPLLEWADHPVAVDPDEKLLAVAEQRNWPVISLR